MSDALTKMIEMTDAQSILRADYADKRAAILAPVAAAIEDLDAEYEAMFDAAQLAVDVATEAARAEALANGQAGGERIETDRVMLVYSGGRESVDMKAFRGYCAAHPEARVLMRVGEPSVSVRWK